MIATLANLWRILDRQSRRSAAGLFGLMVLGAATEAFGLGLVIPVLQILSDEGQISESPLLARLYRASGSDTPENFLLPVMAALAAAYALKSVLTLAISYRTYITVYGAAARLAVRMHSNYIHCPLTFHLQTNSATLLRNVIALPVEVCGALLGPVIVLSTEILVIAAILTILLVAQPVATAVAGGIVALVAGAYFLGVRRLLQRWGEAVVGLARDRIQWTNQSMAAVREIKVSGSEAFVRRRFSDVNQAWARTKTLSSFVGESPRPILELVVVLLVLGGSVLLLRLGYRAGELVGVMGLFGMAAIRLLPSLSRVTFNLGNLKLNAAALQTLRDDMDLFGKTSEEAAEIDQSPIRFEHDIRFESLSYTYPAAPSPTIDKVDLTIRRGEAVAFVGSSGAGKTTLANILIGLLAPTCGRILIDGIPVDCRRRAWRSKIGYIPQDVYLLDDTVRRNVAFGLEDSEIDDGRVWEVLSLAAMTETVRALPQGLDTLLGERGARLSGGQRQRIAIARALYRNPELLVLDEATSALDSATEADVNRAVRSLAGERTVVVVAHRVTTVRDMDTVHYFEGGRLVASGSFAELERDCPQFRHVVLGIDTEGVVAAR